MTYPAGGPPFVYELAAQVSVTLWPETVPVGTFPPPSVFALATLDPEPHSDHDEQPAHRGSPRNSYALLTAVTSTGIVKIAPWQDLSEALLMLTAAESVNVEVAPAARSRVRPL